MPESDRIHAASTDQDYAAFGALVAEYVEWCRHRYQEHAGVVDRIFGYQALDDELAHLATKYGPPNGVTLLAMRAAEVQGAGAYHRLGDGACELKRLFVPDRCRGRGTGRRLCNALMESARTEGFTRMRLDTGSLFTEAISMYRSLGFVECAPYQTYPPELMSDIVFMERSLAHPLRTGGSA